MSKTTSVKLIGQLYAEGMSWEDIIQVNLVAACALLVLRFEKPEAAKILIKIAEGVLENPGYDDAKLDIFRDLIKDVDPDKGAMH